MATAVYAGSFDPVTNGHLDIVIRAAPLFERLVIGVFDTPSKSLLFTTEERVMLCRDAARHLPNVEVTAYEGLTVDFARNIGASFMVRGLRGITDFDNEFAMFMMNRTLEQGVDTVFLMTSQEYAFVSSTLLKEVAQYGGDISGLVPKNVAAALMERFRPRA